MIFRKCRTILFGGVANLHPVENRGWQRPVSTEMSVLRKESVMKRVGPRGTYLKVGILGRDQLDVTASKGEGCRVAVCKKVPEWVEETGEFVGPRTTTTPLSVVLHLQREQ